MSRNIPTLFNVAMLGLARSLQSQPHVPSAIYADGITVWATTGPLWHKEETLQAAAKLVEAYVTQRGMKRAPHKSELTRIWKGKGNRSVPTDPQRKLEVYMAGREIEEKTAIRILGMLLQSNRRCA